MGALNKPVSSDWCHSPRSTAGIFGASSSSNEQVGVLTPHGFGMGATKNAHQVVNAFLDIIWV